MVSSAYIEILLFVENVAKKNEINDKKKKKRVKNYLDIRYKGHCTNPMNDACRMNIL